MLIHRKPQLYRFPFNYIQLASNFHKAMLIGLGVASTNRTDKFWHTGSAEGIAPRSLMVEGFVPMLKFGDLSSNCSE